MISHGILRRALGLALALLAAASGAESEPHWSDWDLEERIAAVSDSELRLLADGVPPRVHLHENHVRVEAESN
jgi:hypothetical protein